MLLGVAQGVTVPNLQLLLPKSLVSNSGQLLRQPQRLSKSLSVCQHMHLVDQGSGELWRFCSDEDTGIRSRRAKGEGGEIVDLFATVVRFVQDPQFP